MAIGLDLDGVIIDHHENKRALAADFGYELERWQTNTNVMRKFVPEDIYKKLQTILYRIYTPKAPPVAGSLEGLRALKGAYIISAREPNAIPFAEEWFAKNGIYNLIPKEKIIFCSNGASKGPLCEQFKITHFLDDKLSFLKYLPLKTKKILFDEDGVAGELNISPEIQLASSWSEFLSLTQIKRN